jgi:hypothetical protein
MMLMATPGASRIDWLAVAYVLGKAILAVGLWGGTAIGYLRGRLSVLERVFAFAAAAFLVTAVPWTDYVGFAASAVFLAWHLLRTRGPQEADPPRLVSAGAGGGAIDAGSPHLPSQSAPGPTPHCSASACSSRARCRPRCRPTRSRSPGGIR